MIEANMSVTIVVDPDFDERLLSLADEMPVWVSDTPTNRTVTESLWSRDASNVTNFRVAGDDATEWCRAILPQVDSITANTLKRVRPNNSFDASGGCVFRMMIRPAMLE